jgi:hypothetical protein
MDHDSDSLRKKRKEKIKIRTVKLEKMPKLKASSSDGTSTIHNLS